VSEAVFRSIREYSKMETNSEGTQGGPVHETGERLSEAEALLSISRALAGKLELEEILTKERMAAIGQTVSGLAHCIKNILNGIRSGSTVIDRAMDTGDFEGVRRGWQTVRQNNGMLSTLVLDML